jgi:hypothetical protein
MQSQKRNTCRDWIHVQSHAKKQGGVRVELKEALVLRAITLCVPYGSI